MATIGELATLVTAKTAPFEKAMKRASGKARTFAGDVKKSIGGAMRFIGRTMTSVPALLGGAGGVGLLGYSLKLATAAEDAEAIYTTFLKDGNKAKTLLRDLGRFSQDTIFDTDTVRDAGRQMLAFGFDVNKVMPLMDTLGEVAAGTMIPISDFVDIVGKVRTQGRAQMEEINRFAERGVDIFPALAKVMGTTNDQIRTLVTEGKVGIEEVVAALETFSQPGGMFEGAMKARAETTGGMLAKLKDQLKSVLRDIGSEILSGLDLKALIAQVGQLAAVYKDDIVRITVAGVDLFKKAIENVPGIINRGQLYWQGLGANARELYGRFMANTSYNDSDRNYYRRMQQKANRDFNEIQGRYEQSLMNTPGNRRLQESFRRDRQPDQTMIDSQRWRQQQIQAEQLRVQKQMRDLLSSQSPELVIGNF